MERKYCKQLIEQATTDSGLAWRIYDEPHKKHHKVDLAYSADYGPAKNYTWFIDLIKKDVKKLNPNFEMSEWCSLMAYTEGSFFKPHTDASSYDAYLSAGYNLNKEFEGGDYIIKGHTIYPDIGELFTFGRDDVHEVTEITKGTRFSVHFAIKNTQKSLF